MSESEEPRGKEAFEEWTKYFNCDDPYWKISKRYVDPSRSSRLMQKFNKIETEHPGWPDHMVSGYPTYYAILCVPKDASEEVLKESYEVKKEHSIYGPELVEEAYNTLNDEKASEDYVAALELFERVSQVLKPIDKKEIIKKHEEFLQEEKTYAISSYLEDLHKEWIGLFIKGAPTFYGMLGVDDGASKEEIEEKYNSMDKSDLVSEIYSILVDEDLKWDYDLLISFFEENINEFFLIQIKGNRDRWDIREHEGLLLKFLKNHDDIVRLDTLLTEHGDWKDYLPPNESFYDILSIKREDVPEKDEDVEKFLMEAFLNHENDDKANLSFESLKQFDLREEYDWLVENHEWINQLNEIMSPKREEEESEVPLEE
ncbi:MAG: hypothetical protein SVY15_05180 [Halobacteriota archaeon]|nr:hypothetical protein [Halobacteriota archaeon]